jgi:O-antigen/teichoic acid export membrane protein
LAYIPDFIYRPGVLLLYVALLLVLNVKPTVSHVLWAFVVSNTLVAIGQALFLGRAGLLPRHWFTVSPTFSKRLRSRALALMIVGFVATSYSDLVTMLAGFLLPAQDVALLGISIRLAAIGGFVVQASQQFILPDLTAAITKRDETSERNLLLRMNIITLATLGLGLLAVILFGETVLSIFGEHYRHAKLLLILFMVGQSIRAFSGMNQYLLSIAGRQVRTAGACLTAMVVLISASVIFTVQFGSIGIGYAVILAELVWTTLLAAQAQHILGRRGDLFWLLTKR